MSHIVALNESIWEKVGKYIEYCSSTFLVKDYQSRFSSAMVSRSKLKKVSVMEDRLTSGGA